MSTRKFRFPRLITLSLCCLFVAAFGIVEAGPTHPANAAAGTAWQEFVISEATLQRGQHAGTVSDGAALQLSAGALEGVYTSPVIEAPQLFTDLGPHWLAQTTGAANYQLAVRTGVDGLTWTDWVDSVQPGEIDVDEKGQTFAPLVFVPQSDGVHRYIQFKLTLQKSDSASIEIRGITFFLIDSRSGPTTLQAVRNQQTLDQRSAPNKQTPTTIGLPKPSVISRTAWGNPQGQNSNWRPRYATVQHIIIHHTDTPNTDTDWAARVRSIWHYHTYSKNWGDIGYNYLVDPNGNIYEGRAGGDNVIGAHALGFNTGTMGVSFLGTFSNQAPQQAAWNAAANLIAWKVDQRNLNPHGTGAQNGRTYATIAGHRNVNSTSCPGNSLYGRLPALRDEVANRLVAERDNVIVGYGQTDSNTISPQSDEDSYYFDGTAGDGVEIMMDATGGNLDPFLRLLGPDGSLVAVDDDSGVGKNAKIIQTLSQAGRYRVIARSWQNCCTGNYSFRVNLVASDPDDRRWLAFSQTLPGTIQPNNDQDVYFFSGVAGRVVSIRMNKIDAGLDPFIELWSPAGVQIATNDDGGGNQNAWLVRILPANGTYRIVARSWNQSSSGRYEVRLFSEQASNLARNQPAVASSIEESWLTAPQVNDGNVNTRWSSLYRDPSWIYIDLGQDKTFNQVVLKWETAYARQYGIYVQANALAGTSQWQNVYSTETGDGGTDTITFAPVNARYVLMSGTARGTSWGYSLWEFEIYNTANALIPLVPPDPDGKTADTIAPLMPLGPTDDAKEVELSGDGETGQEDMPLALGTSLTSTIDTSVSYTIPSATIVGMPAIANQGETVTLIGSGSDLDGGTLQDYIWYSDFAGQLDHSDQSGALPAIGDQATVNWDTTDLPIGIHQVYFQVKDDEGVWSGPASRQITILGKTYLPLILR